MPSPKMVKNLGRGPNNNSGGGRVALPVSARVGMGGGKRPAQSNSAGGRMAVGSARVGMGAGMKTPHMKNGGTLPTKGGRY